MGIPPVVFFGIDCLACFGVNATPAKLWCSIQGVLICPWAQGLGLLPPNGLFELTQFEACGWKYICPMYQIFYYSTGIPRAMSIRHGTGQFWFLNDDGPDCRNAFTNKIVCVPNLTYGHAGAIALTY